MHDRVVVARRWVAATVLAVATFYLAALVSLAAWAFVPSVVGWVPMAIGSGSMNPRVAAGDIVVVDRSDGRDLATGTVVTFREEGRLVTHRIHAVTDDGYVTKGDANPDPDSTPVTADAIVGTGRVLVPTLARPLLWLQHGNHAPAAVWGLLTLAALAVVTGRPGASGSTTRRPRPTDRQRGLVAAGDAPPSHTGTEPPTVALRPTVPPACLPPDTVWHAPQPPHARHRARAGWSRRVRRAAVAALIAALLAGGLASGRIEVTAAALAGTTTSPGNWTADLAPPTNLQATAGCHNSEADAHVDLSWAATPDADGYDVFRTTDPNTGYTNIARVAGGATDQYRDTTVVDDTYHYRLVATAASFRSAPSESVEVVVAASALPCL